MYGLLGRTCAEKDAEYALAGTSVSLDAGLIRFLKLLPYSSMKLTRMHTSSSLLKSIFLRHATAGSKRTINYFEYMHTVYTYIQYECLPIVVSVIYKLENVSNRLRYETRTSSSGRSIRSKDTIRLP